MATNCDGLIIFGRATFRLHILDSCVDRMLNVLELPRPSACVPRHYVLVLMS
jgi:hypothetical protein